MKLTPKIKKGWTAALRSGKYFQGTGHLKSTRMDKAKHCCLGVLCEVMKMDDTEIETVDKEYVPHGYYLSLESFLTKGQQKNLIELNDSDRASFSEIANWIDENL